MPKRTAIWRRVSAQGRMVDAVREARDAVPLKPNDDRVHFNLANVLLQRCSGADADGSDRRVPARDRSTRQCGRALQPRRPAGRSGAGAGRQRHCGGGGSRAENAEAHRTRRGARPARQARRGIAEEPERRAPEPIDGGTEQPCRFVQGQSGFGLVEPARSMTQALESDTVRSLLSTRFDGRRATDCVCRSVSVARIRGLERSEGRGTSGPAQAPAAGSEREVVDCYWCPATMTAEDLRVVARKLDVSNVDSSPDVWGNVARSCRRGRCRHRAHAGRTKQPVSHAGGVQWRPAANYRPPGRAPESRRANPSPSEPQRPRERDSRFLALDVDVTALLPPDDSAYGFETFRTCSAFRHRCRNGTWPRPGASPRWPWSDPEDPRRQRHLPRSPGPVGQPARDGLPAGTVGGTRQLTLSRSTATTTSR